MRHCGRHHQRAAAERLISRVIRESGCPRPLRRFYVCFARELYLTLRHPPARRAASHKPQAPGWTLDHLTTGPPPSVDFSVATKRVVARWFGRGLSGHLLWLIGDRMIDLMFPDARSKGR